MNTAMGIDVELFLWLNQTLNSPLATALFSTVAYLGNGLVLALLILPLLFFFDGRRFREHALALIIAVALGGGLVFLIKIALNRPRPPEHFAERGIVIHAPLGCPEDRSFPSGHSQTALGAATYLAFLYPAAAPALVGAGLAVAVSRVALGVHFPADVLAGAALGCLCSLAVFLVNRRRLSWAAGLGRRGQVRPNS